MASSPTSLVTGPAPTRSLVSIPTVVAHRGASGSRPEHTLAAYREAIRQGADDIEIDLVTTADGVLVARHEPEISGTTDVALRAEFAQRRTSKVIDGQTLDGWFTEDFTFAELKTLTARERLPRLRPANCAFDGTEGIPSFTEILACVQAEGVRRGRAVGVLVELKHAHYYDQLGLPLELPLLSDLRHHRLLDPHAAVSLMSFEPGILQRLAGECRLPLIQLLGQRREQPADLADQGDDRTYGDLITTAGLSWMDEYADGLGAAKGLVLPRSSEGYLGEPTTLVREAHELGLTVQVWTLRAENSFLPKNLRRGVGAAAHGDLAAEAQAFLAVGVDGLITDHPELLRNVVVPQQGARQGMWP